MAVQPTAQTAGKDFNYFKEITISGLTDFPSVAQAFAKFRGARRMMFVCTDGAVEYSFNGNTLHGSMDTTKASAILNFGTRMEDKIWFRGTGTVQVHIWQLGV